MHLEVWQTLLILGAVVAVSFGLGNWLASSWRMADYGWRLGLVIVSVAFSTAICLLLWPPKLGIDLSGGVILVYEIDEAATKRQQEAQDARVKTVTSKDIVPAIQMRLNPSGLADVIVRPYGEDQVEVIIPHVEEAEINRIKNIISKAGFLEFRIVANPRDHDHIIEAASDEANRGVTQVRDPDGRVIGIWSALGREQQGANRGAYRMSPLSTIYRNHDTGDVLTDASGNLRSEFLPADPKERDALMNRFADRENGERNVEDYFEDKLGIKNIDVLMSADDGYNIRGSHVESVAAGFDEHGFPSINFVMTPDGAILFQGLTGDNSPDPQTGFKRRLGILMDNSLISAPELRSMISRNGQITGRFAQEEVDDLVQIIRGGSLPAALIPQPTTESQISPLLGGVTIRQSVISLSLAMAFTLVIMAYYYRFAGLVACFALIANTVITVALMILLKASFTLPGIAGLMLSVGMSVDANILIYERIREEIARGAKIRMALRNGFARATTTIIDSNVTTLIAGVVLYAIGTDIIRGFAVTLNLGLLISMFTAVFCARVILEIGDRRHWYRTLYMVNWIKETHFDFMGKRAIAVGGSVLLMVVGLVAAVARGVDLLDIDLAGGTSVHVLLTEPLTETQLREKLEKDKFLNVYHQVVAEERKSLPSTPDNAAKLAELDEELKISDFDLTLNGLPEYTDDEGRALQSGQAWRIDTSIPSVDHLQAVVQKILDEGKGLLVKREVDFTPPEAVTTPSPKTEAEKSPAKTGNAEQPPATGSTPTGPANTAPSAGKATPAATPEATTPPAAEAPAVEDPRASEPRPPQAPDEENGAGLDRPESNLYVMAGDGDFLLLAQADQAPPADAQPADAQPADAQPADGNAPAADETPAKAPAAEENAANTPPAGAPAAAEAAAPKAEQSTAMVGKPAPRGASKSDLAFRYRISEDALKFQILDVAKNLGLDLSADQIKLKAQGDTGKKWSVILPLHPEQAGNVLRTLKSDFANTPVYPSSSKIGSKVAANMQQTAVMAMVLSFLGIVIYLWVRFQKVAYGVAAVIATLHDVLITLGLVAITHYLSPFLGFLLIENFKINLSVIAAFLTLIGYSINDTIVIFDRIREVRGKSPRLTATMVNDSVNQTLGRTFLTGGTVLVSLLILYVLGGQGIRGFAFTMLVGIIVGTYSSVFVGPPVLLWLAEGSKTHPEGEGADGKKLAAAPAERS